MQTYNICFCTVSPSKAVRCTSKAVKTCLRLKPSCRIYISPYEFLKHVYCRLENMMSITSWIYLLACTIKMHTRTAAKMKGPRQDRLFINYIQEDKGHQKANWGCRLNSCHRTNRMDMIQSDDQKQVFGPCQR
jgi:hypothetical protein